jgi:2-polyprenyl-6-methoxyphenol hydroxylase-like FAD-dependent oxidoreductase
MNPPTEPAPVESSSIIGAGIAGLALAKALVTIGWTTHVHEQAAELEPLGAGLLLTTNGLRALQALGLFDAVVAEGQPILRVSILDRDGHTLHTVDHGLLSRRFGHTSALALHRADLHRVLLEHAGRSRIHMGKRCLAVRSRDECVELTFDDGHKLEERLAFGCDGVHSEVRRALFPESSERFAGYTCWRGIAPVKPAGMDESHVTESWGGGQRFGLVPLRGGRVYWFACLSAERPRADEFARFDIRRLRERFSRFHRPIDEVLASTPEDTLIWTDIVDIDPLPFHAARRIALLGDAAHAVTPDLGQGACQALEDVAVLALLLKRWPPDEAFSEYNRLRVSRTRQLILESRRFGRVAQWHHPAAVQLRNFVVRHLPKRVLERQLDELLDVRFESIAPSSPSTNVQH